MPEVIKYQTASEDVCPIVAKIVTAPVENIGNRKNCVFIRNNHSDDCTNYAAVIEQDKFISKIGRFICIQEANSIWQEGDVIQIIPSEQKIISLFKQAWHANGLYVTDLCNSHCIMCPQPPQTSDSINQQFLDQFIDCLPNNVGSFGITGGEPTLLGKRLIHILHQLSLKSPECETHILSNARLLRDYGYAKEIAECGLKRLSFGIPLYSCIPEKHNFIVQSKNAFTETCEDIANLERLGIPIEIRIVLQKQVVPGLHELVRWLFFNMPYVSHIALMGMEHTGYVHKNWDLLWISPKDYQIELFNSVQYLHLRGMNVSIYNLPLCLLDRILWQFARDSISDFKISYADECNHCVERNHCGGLFKYQKSSMPIKAILA